jgi:hypothetical protein
MQILITSLNLNLLPKIVECNWTSWAWLVGVSLFRKCLFQILTWIHAGYYFNGTPNVLDWFS